MAKASKATAMHRRDVAFQMAVTGDTFDDFCEIAAARKWGVAESTLRFYWAGALKAVEEHMRETRAERIQRHLNYCIAMQSEAKRSGNEKMLYRWCQYEARIAGLEPKDDTAMEIRKEIERVDGIVKAIKAQHMVQLQEQMNAKLRITAGPNEADRVRLEPGEQPGVDDPLDVPAEGADRREREEGAAEP